MGLTASIYRDDFSRKVYCVLGTPVDEISMAALVGCIQEASVLRRRLFLSTPNLNFLMLSRRDSNFRRSLLESDLCPADGVGVLLICRFLGVPIRSRIAGSDLPGALQAAPNEFGASPLRIALLGGAPGVGELACKALNTGGTDHVICVAAIDPGVMTVDKMTDPALVKRVNATVADVLLVALGAQKGQAWLLHHMERLSVPVVSHLGATVNFLAGTVKRAPEGIRKMGLEWLWRVKEEPHLAGRYLSDGTRLLWLMLTQIMPLGIWLRWHRSAGNPKRPSVRLDADQAEHSRIIISGAARDNVLGPVVEAFRSTTRAGHRVTLDLRDLQFFGMEFAGQILMLEKAALKQNLSLSIVARPAIGRALGWCGLKHLIGKTAHN